MSVCLATGEFALLSCCSRRPGNYEKQPTSGNVHKVTREMYRKCLAPVGGESDTFVDGAELFLFTVVEVRVQTLLLKVVQLLNSLVTQEQL